MRRLLVTLVLLGVLRLLFLNDIPFINDEALLIKQALQDNEAGILTTHGLMGSRGVDYGPFAIWFYRIALFFSHHILFVAAFKIIFVTTLTAISVLLVATHIRGLVPLFGTLAFLSPYLWFYARDLWDNSFVIPISALALSTYIAFLRTRKLPYLFIAAVSVSCGFLTHLVFLPILLGMLTHFLLYRPLPFSFKRWGQLALVAALPALPYFLHLLGQHPGQKFAPGNIGHFLMPFTGTRFFTGFGLEYFFGQKWFHITGTTLDYAWIGLLAISLIAYPLFAGGFLSIIGEVVRKKDDAIIWALCLLCFLFQCLLSWTYRLIPVPNFHSSMWFIYLLVLWHALSQLPRLGPWLFRGISVALAASIVAMTTLIHFHGGNRENHHGPTLGNLRILANTLTGFSDDTPVEMAARHPRDFPWAIEALQELSGISSSITVRVPWVRVTYARPDLPSDGRITVVTPDSVLNQ